MIKAKIVRAESGIIQIYCKRDKYKHWFELGKHGPTDSAFSKALKNGSILWQPVIDDKMKLF